MDEMVSQSVLDTLARFIGHFLPSFTGDRCLPYSLFFNHRILCSNMALRISGEATQIPSCYCFFSTLMSLLHFILGRQAPWNSSSKPLSSLSASKMLWSEFSSPAANLRSSAELRSQLVKPTVAPLWVIDSGARDVLAKKTVVHMVSLV